MHRQQYVLEGGWPYTWRLLTNTTVDEKKGNKTAEADVRSAGRAGRGVLAAIYWLVYYYTY